MDLSQLLKEKRELESLEAEITELESEKEEIEKTLHKGMDDFEKLNTLTSRVSEIILLLDEKETRWLELDEKNN